MPSSAEGLLLADVEVDETIRLYKALQVLDTLGVIGEEAAAVQEEGVLVREVQEFADVLAEFVDGAVLLQPEPR